VSDAEMAKLNIKHADFHGEWNYTIKPRKSKKVTRLICLKPLLDTCDIFHSDIREVPFK
jgi:hypothetical protein